MYKNMKSFKNFLELGNHLKEVLDLTSGSEDEAISKAYHDFKKSGAPQFNGKSDKEIRDMAVAAVKSARK